MAMMRKKQKKNKNGKQTEDIFQGEDPRTEDTPDLTEKAPVEASIEDDFALPEKKGKGKNVPARSGKDDEDEDEDEERGADGKVLTKAQKEKAKKEREKQRKKENVCLISVSITRTIANTQLCRLRKRKLPPLLPKSKHRNLSLKLKKSRLLRNPPPARRERNCHLLLPSSNNNRRS
jgi:hypothetical protein